MITNERFKTLFLNWWEIAEKDMTLSDMEAICKDIGMTRGEFIELVSQSNEFISKNGWTPPEPEANEKVNIETSDCDYSRLITMLDKVNAPYRKLAKNIIELYDDNYTSVEFHFDENFELASVEW